MRFVIGILILCGMALAQTAQPYPIVGQPWESTASLAWTRSRRTSRPSDSRLASRSMVPVTFSPQTNSINVLPNP